MIKATLERRRLLLCQDRNSGRSESAGERQGIAGLRAPKYWKRSPRNTLSAHHSNPLILFPFSVFHPKAKPEHL